MNLRERSASLASVARFVAGVQRGEARRSVQRSAFSVQRSASNAKPRSHEATKRATLTSEQGEAFSVARFASLTSVARQRRTV